MLTKRIRSLSLIAVGKLTFLHKNRWTFIWNERVAVQAIIRLLSLIAAGKLTFLHKNRWTGILNDRKAAQASLSIRYLTLMSRL